MKTLLSIFLIAVCLLLLKDSFSQNRHLQVTAEHETYTCRFSNKNPSGLDSFISAYMSQNHIAGVSSCIVKRGVVIWTGSYGYAYVNLNILIRDSTLFQIASVSKTVTTAALMHLNERGRFALDDSINAYLPFAVRNPYHPNLPITFRMLLTHTSSIRDNWSVMFYYYHSDPPLTLGDYLNKYFTPDSEYYSLQNFYSYTPGSSWAYCNIGFALAGYLVEAITGIELSQYCRDSMFAPLGMNESSFFYRDLDSMHMAMPYRWSPGNFMPYGHYSYHDYPAGALKTSTVQLARFLIAFMQYGKIGNVRILDSVTVKLIITPQIPTINQWQGICWYKSTIGTRELWGHHGGDFGIRTGMFFCPADTSGVLVFTNGETSIDPIANEMFNYASGYIIGVPQISSDIPARFSLYRNYPNPFNPVTNIRYEIPKTSHVRLVIYNALGQEIESLVNETLQPGSYKVVWNANNYPSGVYFFKLTAEDYTETRKMILLK